MIQFSEPKRGTYKKLIVRDGRLVGGILMGDISKAAVSDAGVRPRQPLPDERLSLLFDLGTPVAEGDLRRDAGRRRRSATATA